MDEQQRIEGVSIALRDVHTRRERGQTHHTETNFDSRRRLLINLHVPIDRRSARYDQRTRDDVSPRLLRGIDRISVLGPIGPGSRVLLSPMLSRRLTSHETTRRANRIRNNQFHEICRVSRPPGLSQAQGGMKTVNSLHPRRRPSLLHLLLGLAHT